MNAIVKNHRIELDEFFDNDEKLDLIGEVLEELIREGIRESDFEDVGVRERFFNELIRGSRGDDTDATITRRVEFDAIEGGLGRFVGERFDAFFETDAHLTRKRRNRNESLRILLEGVDAVEFDRIA